MEEKMSSTNLEWKITLKNMITGEKRKLTKRHPDKEQNKRS
jgi:hypothetical protein